MIVHRIKVEQKHIDQGKACDSSSCPIALALADKFTKGEPSIYRDIVVTTITDEGIFMTESMKTPTTALQRLVKYDLQGVMEPFEFMLETKHKA